MQHLPPTLSLLFAILTVALPLVGLAIAIARWAPNRALARRPLDQAQQDVRVLRGRVAYAEGSSCAMRVEIDQRGSEHDGSSGYWTRWTEVDRRVRVAPFYVLHEDGSRTRVEPTPDAYLVDALDGKIVVRTDFRTRYAELTPDEEVWVAGEVSMGADPEARGDYRGAAKVPIVRAPKRGLLLVSSEPLEKRYQLRARYFLKWAVLFAALVVASAGAMSPFVDRLAGTTTTGVVKQVTEAVDDDGHHTGWTITATGTFGSATNTLSEAARVGSVIPVRVGRFSAQVGGRATLHAAWLCASGLTIAALIAFMMHVRKSLPWYQGRVTDRAPGRLGG
ncbi:MAG: hypothetical protein U0414_06035 [Polyangiaceae bacterium]